MNLTAARLAASAQRFMAENPSSLGWKRHQGGSCGGGHRSGLWVGDGLIYWRRPRDMFDDTTYRMLDPADDPVLWVAESVPPALCCSDFFFWANTLPAIRALDVTPWSVSTPAPKAGATVRLDTANGSWVWQIVGERDCVCGGWMARWPD